MVFTPHPSDPFYELMKPPEDETQAQKTARLNREADAQRMNDAIEDQIKADRARIQREERIAKVLLLSQSESDVNYTATDDDIFRSQFGIQEYEMTMNREIVRIFNVPGDCHTLRRAWLPYFENMTAIIFLLPVSVFDERLENHPRVNRLKDSIILWTAICSSQLLAKVQLILVLTECDLLDQKLKRGIKVNQYIPSYGARSNDAATFIKYLREYFKTIMRNHRSLDFTYLTISDSLKEGRACDAVFDAVKNATLRESLYTARLV